VLTVFCGRWKDLVWHMGSHGFAVFGDRLEEREHQQHEPVHAAFGELPAALIGTAAPKWGCEAQSLR